MVESEDEGYVSKPMFGIYSKNNSSKTITHNNKFIGSTTFSSSQMKRSVRPVFSLLLFIVVAVTFGCRAAIRNGFGSFYGNNDYIAANYVPQFDLPVFNSTLIKLAEIDVGEPKLRIEIDQLMEGHVGDIARLRTFAAWRRFFRGGSIPARTSKGVPVNPESPEFFRVWSKFRRSLGDWSRKKRFNPNIMDDLVDLVKIPIDNHNGLFVGAKRKYSSCAVVGNSGILLSKEYGGLIDSHEAVIRLNNARIESYQRNVGSKTSISFVNSNILHLCARKEDCFCHPYGSITPIVMYMCQPLQFLDYVVCNSSHKAPLIVTDPRFDMLCARIVKYYSLKRFADAPNKTLEQWNTAHDGSMFHYSSGMQAVMLSLGICDRVSLFGFGKSTEAKHHYHTNQKAELNLHDYLAEYDLYRDLVHRPRAVPFVSNKFNFPPVVIHR